MHLLVLGRSLDSCGALAETLAARGHRLSASVDQAEALELVRTRRVDVVLLDLRQGEGVLDRLAELAPALPVLVLGEEDRARAAARASALGALGYVVLPPDAPCDAETAREVTALVDRAAARARVEARRRDALEASLRTRTFYEAVLTSVGQGIVVVDHAGRISYLNPEAARILGEEDQGDGRAAVPLLQMLVETLAEGEPGARTLALEEEDQKVFLDVSTSVLRGPDGKASGAVAIVSDRSTEKRLEEQLVHTERLATLGSLLASIAHEITNSLTSITGCAEMGLEVADTAEQAAAGVSDGEASRVLRDVSEEIRDIFDMVLQAGLSAQTIANNLLQYSRRTPGSLVRQDLGALIRRTLDMLGKHLGLDEVELELDLDVRGPAVRVEPSKVQQAIVNLIVNAVQAMHDLPRERRSLRVETRCDTDVRDALLVVADTGPGIPPRRLERIWQPFFTTKGHGTGLGLYITRKVIEDQGGRIDVQSTQGVGTRFTIRLPLE